MRSYCSGLEEVHVETRRAEFHLTLISVIREIFTAVVPLKAGLVWATFYFSWEHSSMKPQGRKEQIHFQLTRFSPLLPSFFISTAKHQLQFCACKWGEVFSLCDLWPQRWGCGNSPCFHCGWFWPPFSWQPFQNSWQNSFQCRHHIEAHLHADHTQAVVQVPVGRWR